MMAPVDGGVTAPAGFRATGVRCGIKKANLDLALVVPDGAASAAGVSLRWRRRRASNRSRCKGSALRTMAAATSRAAWQASTVSPVTSTSGAAQPRPQCGPSVTMRTKMLVAVVTVS